MAASSWKKCRATRGAGRSISPVSLHRGHSAPAPSRSPSACCSRFRFSFAFDRTPRTRRKSQVDSVLRRAGGGALHELLNPLPVGIGGVHRALRVDDDAVDPVELAGAPALLAPDRED